MRRGPAVRSSMAIASPCSTATATSAPRLAVPTAFIIAIRDISRHLEMLLNGMQLLLLGSNIRDDNSILTVDLTNPDIYSNEKLVLPKDALHVVRTVFLWPAAAYQRLRIQNHGDRPFKCRFRSHSPAIRRPVRGARTASQTARHFARRASR